MTTKTIRILKHVENYEPGQVVQIAAEKADAMCTIRDKWDGEKTVPYRTAMFIEEWEAIAKAPVDKGGLTQVELAAMGLKNVVETPKDPAFDKKIEKLSTEAPSKNKRVKESA